MADVSRDWPSIRARQAAELEALGTIYGDNLSTDDPVTARVLEDGEESIGLIENSTTLKFSLLLLEGDALDFSLPPSYPLEPALVTLRSKRHFDAANVITTALRTRANEVAQEGDDGEEAIFELCCDAQDRISDIYATAQNESPSSVAKAKTSLMRVFFWAHHIRRKQIDMLELADELSLTGLIMMGKPGYIFVEGELSKMKLAVKRVKAWHWREVKVNFEEIVEADDTDVDIASLRLVQRDDMAIVSHDEFMSTFREAGRVDILTHGTGCPQKSPSGNESER